MHEMFRDSDPELHKLVQEIRAAARGGR
jgi:hypothetical protein